MTKLIGIGLDDLLWEWEACAPFIERCLKKGREHRWNSADVLRRLVRRDQQLWKVVDEDGAILSVTVTEILHYPRCKEMNIFIHAGKFHGGWREHLDELCLWAKCQGCQYVTTTTRRGYVKTLGWEARQTYVVKGLQ